MIFSEGFRESWDMIRHNKLRTFLTMLGMNIGVAAVIAVMATGLMARQAVMSGIESIGTNLIWVRPNTGAYGDALSSVVYMRPSDLTALENQLPDTWTSPLLRGTASMSYRGYQDIATIYGVWPTYERLWNVPVAEGRFITERDITERNKVIVLGSNTAKLFFPDNPNPVGQAVTLGSQSFTVVGVLASRERSALSDGSDDDTSYVPYETYENMYDFSSYGGVRVLLLFFKVKDIANLDDTALHIKQYLYAQYGDYKNQPRFSVNKAEENVNTFNKVFEIITLVISLIAGISLLVGGIGIMNIMLVSVSERTHEIGIRKAIGAKRSDILVQFLVEAIIICLIGGGIGIIFGMIVAYIVAALQHWAYVFPLLGLTLGLCVSVTIGLFFGIYPAYKAARLDPVVALSKE